MRVGLATQGSVCHSGAKVDFSQAVKAPRSNLKCLWWLDVHGRNSSLSQRVSALWRIGEAAILEAAVSFMRLGAIDDDVRSARAGENGTWTCQEQEIIWWHAT